MISVPEALELIRRAAQPLPPQSLELADTLDHVLAEDVTADLDSPPHDKSLVDGYAVRAEDVVEPSAQLTVVARIMAGDVPSLSLTCGRAAQIMTGAPIPAGADAVVMVEHTEVVEEGEQSRVCIGRRAAPGQNIMLRGTSMRAGQCVLPHGKLLRPIEIGVLAEVGRARVLVHPAPTVAIISTGNELVPHDHAPSSGQIRNSNGPMLAALVQRAGGRPRQLGIARDQLDDLHDAIAQGLESDILVLSGGVSAGVLDLTPRVLRELGVAQVFHQVDLKPGKPLWFGLRRHDRGGTLVFGLPGNPVSSLVCFELFVRAAMRALAGHMNWTWEVRPAMLTSEHRQRGDRPTYFPAECSMVQGQRQVRPLAWKGSADLCTLSSANALAYFPPGERTYAVGEAVDTYAFG